MLEKAAEPGFAGLQAFRGLAELVKIAIETESEDRRAGGEEAPGTQPLDLSTAEVVDQGRVGNPVGHQGPEHAGGGVIEHDAKRGDPRGDPGGAGRPCEGNGGEGHARWGSPLGGFGRVWGETGTTSERAKSLEANWKWSPSPKVGRGAGKPLAAASRRARGRRWWRRGELNPDRPLRVHSQTCALTA